MKIRASEIVLKKMMIVTVVILAGFSSLNASYNVKGLKAYKKLCVECHGGPFRGAGMHTIDEWEEILESSKTPMIKIHSNNPEALDKFDGYLTKKRRTYLFKFLIENAKDSGAVAGCDGNYCGRE